MINSPKWRLIYASEHPISSIRQLVIQHLRSTCGSKSLNCHNLAIHARLHTVVFHRHPIERTPHNLSAMAVSKRTIRSGRKTPIPSNTPPHIKVLARNLENLYRNWLAIAYRRCSATHNPPVSQYSPPILSFAPGSFGVHNSLTATFDGFTVTSDKTKDLHNENF